MGLGKTITVLTFLSALQYSGLYTPSLVLCPATMLRQWQYELKQWAPNLRIGILHDSAVDADMALKLDGDRRAARLAVLDDIRKSQNGVLLTTYEHLRVFADTLLDVRWGYVVLDEGHRIRNPDAQITIQAKQVQTPHRLIMSGAPIQNRLSELWSLFDFIFPGRLGTLPVFQSHFAVPIQMGGYKRASGQELSTAYRCAVMLRDMISPYILRRMKADVDCVLPDKKEEVLFCPLTHEQREQYRSYINSAEVQEIMSGNRELLQGLDVLKKISNHPDLLDRVHTAGRSGYGSTDRSGKLLVAEKLFTLWHSQGHRCLVFSQTQQMLDILELLSAKNGLTYRRMDGSTPVGAAHLALFICNRMLQMPCSVIERRCLNAHRKTIQVH
jgi:DNA excision repair protein ERCC-6